MTDRCFLKVLKIRPETTEMSNGAAGIISMKIHRTVSAKNSVALSRRKTNLKKEMQIDSPFSGKEFLQRINEKEMQRSIKLIPMLNSGHHIM